MYVTLGGWCLCEPVRRKKGFTVLGTKVYDPAYGSVYARASRERPSITTQPYTAVENNTRTQQK